MSYLPPPLAFRALAASTLISLALALPAAACTKPRDLAGLNSGAIQSVNAERAKRGMAALRPNDSLTAMAQKLACDNAAKGKLSHTGSDGSFKARLRKWGYGKGTENVAYGYKAVSGTMQGWMKSPPHRRNILTASNTIAGSGVAIGSNGQYYWALVMAAGE